MAESLKGDQTGLDFQKAKTLTVGKLDISGIKERDKVFVYGKISSLEGKLISKNRIFLVDFKYLDLPETRINTNLEKISSGIYKLSLTSDKFVWMVSIDVPDSVSLSNNYFDIFPGEEIKIFLKSVKEINLSDIKISSLNETTKRYAG